MRFWLLPRLRLLQLLTHPVSALVFMLLGLAISAGASWMTYRLVAESQAQAFAARTALAQSALEQHLRANIEVVHGLQSLLAADARLDRADFQRYYRQLQLTQRFPGIQAVVFNPQVLVAERAAFEAKTRRDNSLRPQAYPEFAIWPAGERAVYYVIDWVEPALGNGKAFGFDLGSEPMRRKMVESARDTGRLATSAPVELMSDDVGVRGFLLALPVYAGGDTPATEAGRRAAFRGVVTVVYRCDALFGALFPADFLALFDVGIEHLRDVDVDASTDIHAAHAVAGFHFASRPPALWPSRADLIRRETELSVGDQHWRLSFQARPAFYQPVQQWLPVLAALIGIGTSVLVFITLRALSAAQQRSEQERNQAVRAQRHSEAKLAAIIESLDEVIWSVDLPGWRLNYLSPAAADIYGHPASALLSEPELWLELIHDDDRPRLFEAMHRILTERSYTLEYRICRPDGGERWLHDEATLVLDDSGTAVRVDGIVTDISVRRNAEQQLHKLSRIVEQSPAAIVITDAHGAIEYVNPRFCTLSGYAETELLGKNPRLLASGLTPKATYEQIWRQLRDGHAWHGELLNRKKSGELFWEMETIAPLRDENSTVINFFAIKEDVTALKNYSSELARTNRVLRVLSECNGALVRAQSEAELLAEITRILVDLGNYRLAWIAYRDEQNTGAVRAVAQCGFDLPVLLAALPQVRCDDSPGGSGPTGRALRSGQIVTLKGEELPDFTPFRAAYSEAGIQAIISLPLRCEGLVIGALSLFSQDPAGFDENEKKLLIELAGDLSYGIAVQRSADEKRRAEADLFLRERALDSSSNGIMISDSSLPDHPAIYINPAFTRITGYAADAILGRNGRILLGSDTEQPGLSELRAALREFRETKVRLRCYRPDGSRFWVHLAVAPVYDQGGRASHVVSVLSDISEQIRYETELEYQATHDSLTTLANRALMRDRLVQAIALSERERQLAAVLLLDLDHFKLINDSMGHSAGDRFLCAIAERLQTCVQPGDTVARLGGDEFVVIMASLASVETADQLAEKLRLVLSQPVKLDEREMFPTASIGIALYPRDGLDAGTLLRNADTAMYHAKSEGGGHACHYAETQTQVVSRRVELESALRTALAEQQLQLYYQPKIHLRSGRICGVEALLRWQHPELGMVSPAEFIPVAELSGLILPIGQWVLRAAMAQGRDWLALGLPPLHIAINLSARQFTDSRLCELLQQSLSDSGFPASQIILEITESLLMQAPEQAIKVMNELKAMGFRLSLDDFGTGYSSLNYLRRFPIDQLKIDQSFVRELISDANCATIAVSIINLAHNLQLEVVAEGVENSDQMRFLSQRNCHEAQGYLFSRPVPAAELAVMLSAHCRFDTIEANTGERCLLAVDDDPSVLSALKRLLRGEPYHLLTAESAQQGFELLATNAVQVVLSDHLMREMSGAEFLGRVKLLYPDSVRLVLSGFGDATSVTDAVNRGAIYKYLHKPWDETVLKAALLDAFNHHERQTGRLVQAPG